MQPDVNKFSIRKLVFVSLSNTVYVSASSEIIKDNV